jgi:MFS transporter, PHS family, inorganic phosphate transporter
VEREMVVSGDTFGLFSSRFQKCHDLHLLATTSTWFLLGITFYSQNLFQKDIFSKVGWISPARTMNDIEKVFRVSRAQALIALCGTVPGYWFTMALIDIVDRFWIQVMGFLMMTMIIIVRAVPYELIQSFTK